jgi:hypothetical protein
MKISLYVIPLGALHLYKRILGPFMYAYGTPKCEYKGIGFNFIFFGINFTVKQSH